MARTVDIRERVLSEHRRIRALLIQIDTARLHVDTIPDGCERLRVLVRRLLALLHRHLAMEERLLAPIIEQADAWGPVRADRMRDEHREQRTIFRGIAEDIEAAAKPRAELVDEVGWLVECLLKDIEQEETELLDVELFRVDSLVIEQFGG